MRVIFLASVVLAHGLVWGMNAHAEPGEDLDQKLSRILPRFEERTHTTNDATTKIWALRPDGRSRSSGLFYIHGDYRPFQGKLILYQDLKRMLRVSEKNNIAIYFVSLPGYMDTKFGNYSIWSNRRNVDAMKSVHEAINASIEQDKLSAVAIIGQSAGAHAAAAHATQGSHSKVRCYGLASGAYQISAVIKHQKLIRYNSRLISGDEYQEFKSNEWKIAGRTIYSPVHHVNSIPKSNQQRFIVLADRKDRYTPFVGAVDFVDELKNTGMMPNWLSARLGTRAVIN